MKKTLVLMSFAMTFSACRQRSESGSQIKGDDSDASSFTESLEAIECVKFATADKTSNMPGGQATGTYSVVVKDGYLANQCALAIQNTLAGVQIGASDDEQHRISGIRPAGSEAATTDGFLAQLESVGCVKFASENRNSSLPGGGKGTGVYTVAVKEDFSARQCADALRAAIPNAEVGAANEQLHTILDVTPPAAAEAANDSFIGMLEAIGCVKFATANKTASMPGGTFTGKYTAVVKEGQSAKQCAKAVLAAVPGARIGSTNDDLASIYDIQAPGGFKSVNKTATPSLVDSLESVACVKFASENTSGTMPGGGQRLGVYTVAVKDGGSASDCAEDLRAAFPNLSIGTVNDQLGTIVDIRSN